MPTAAGLLLLVSVCAVLFTPHRSRGALTTVSWQQHRIPALQLAAAAAHLVGSGLKTECPVCWNWICRERLRPYYRFIRKVFGKFPRHQAKFLTNFLGQKPHHQLVLNCFLNCFLAVELRTPSPKLC
jgi:hypothetical protein